MTKTNKFSTGILAIAIMLMCSAQAWAQSGKAAPPTTASKAVAVQRTPAQAAKDGSPATVSTTPVGQKYPAQAALRDFKADSPIPQLNDMRKEILTNKAELEKAQMENRLSPAEVALAKEKIANQEQEMQPLVAREQRMLGTTSTTTTNQAAVRPERQQQPQQPVVIAEETVPNNARALTPSEEALKNFKADSPNAQINSMRYEVLQLKAELEAGQAENRLSQQEIHDYKAKIAANEAAVQKAIKKSNTN